MALTVEFTDEALADLESYARPGNVRAFLAKLVRLEREGVAASQPLGRGLAGYRKIVVGDRDWRIVFTTNPEETIATVWVIGDRADDACYAEAEARVREAASTGSGPSRTLAAAMLQLMENEGARRRANRKAGRRRR